MTTFSRIARAASLCASVLALAACGLTNSPADGLTFQAPSGWQGSPGIMGFMQFWKAPNDDKEVIMLFKSPKPLDKKDVFSNAKMQDTSVQKEEEIKICGDQQAEFIQARGTSSSSGSSSDSNIQMVMTNAGGNTYFAMYVYPVNQQANEEASTAIRQLCTKR